MNEAVIHEAAQHIISAIAKQQTLWDTQDVADYLRLNKRTVQTHIIARDDFPKAVLLPTGGKRWMPEEVKAWAVRRRG